MDHWLKGAARTLQPDQRRQVLEKFGASVERAPASAGGGPSRGGLPLYLKLAFEEARRWNSAREAHPLSANVPGIIRDLFQRLSQNANHGPLIVSRSLAYLAAAKNALSEDELLDVLILDDEVFEDFENRARHRPPERRLPVVVWLRPFFDLEPYLTERAADGTSLLAFYHRQLREVVEHDYLSPPAKAARHAIVANYFAGRDLYEEEGKVPNVRKLSELPYQQTNAELWEELYNTLTDFDFLEAKCTHVSVVKQGRGPDAAKIRRRVRAAGGLPQGAGGIPDGVRGDGRNFPASTALVDRGDVLVAFARALRFEAHVLHRRPGLCWQLDNRLQWAEEPVPMLLKPHLERERAAGSPRGCGPGLAVANPKRLSRLWEGATARSACMSRKVEEMKTRIV